MSVMIVGSGVSGQAVAEYLDNSGVKYFFAKQEDIDAFSFDEKYIQRLLRDVSQVIVSPGISLRTELVRWAIHKNIDVIGELEFGSEKIINDIIAVTGTNGKTTTVNLINFLLKDSEQGSVMCGNVGVPITSFVGRLSNESIVLECSSFQLETIKDFKPHIAVILNITEDHLNRHLSIDEYIRCKLNITKNQDENDYLLVNADDEILQKQTPKTRAQIFYFSTKKKVVGCYIKNKSIYFNDNKKEIRLASLSKIKLVGEHNLSNILASVLAIFLQTHDLNLLKNLSKFSGVCHRLEFVKKINGISFYNDSKATNIASTIVAVKSFKCDINLILGGSDKGFGFDELFKKMPKNVKRIAIFGQTSAKIAFSARKFGFNNYRIFAGLGAATKALFGQAKAGEIILLSPACASFDFFSNFEERGNFFKQVVREIEFHESSFDYSNKKT